MVSVALVVVLVVLLSRFSPAHLYYSGEQSFSCLLVKRRSPNIMEFKLSEKTSTVMSESLCDDRNFENSKWITEGSKFA